MAYYWPQAGIGIGIVLNMAGLALGEDRLIATGSNVFVICGLFLGQRRRNERD